MMGMLLLSPLLTRFIAAIVLMLCWKQIRMQRLISVLGEFGALILSIRLLSEVWSNGIQSTQAGSWAAPYGISFVADELSAMLLLITSIVGFAVSLFASGSMLNSRLRFGFFPIFHFLLAGISGAFLAGDIFNLYVWFEVMIISSFVLLTLGGERAQIEGAVKYFTLNFLASVVFLTALAVLYGLTGTLNMADLSVRLVLVEQRPLVDVCAFIFFVAFGIKSAVFPLYFWLPASYHTPPTAITAVFGALLTKVGVYAMIRVFTIMFPWDPFIEQMLGIVAVLTIFSGAMGALVQKHIVKALSWLIICHIGFMLAGLATHNEKALAGVLFYMIHDMLAKGGVFLLTGITYRLLGTHLFPRMGGMLSKYPLWTVVMAIPLFSLVGIPPLSGFWPKIDLLFGMAEASQWGFIIMILFGSLLTLVVIARLWMEVFWKPNPMTKQESIRFLNQYPKLKRYLMTAAVLVLVIASLSMVVMAPSLQQWSRQAAKSLLQPAHYIEKVLSVPKDSLP